MDRSASVPGSRGAFKLNSVQYLRGVAAVLVVLCHAATTLLRRQRVLVDLAFGAYGVDIFFVISGFIMVISTAGREVGPADFMARRSIRIFPLYFLLTTLLLLLVLWVVPDSDTASTDLPGYLQSILFIPHWNPLGANLEPLLGQGWTLNDEMFFYAVFALGLCAPKRARLPLVAGALAGLSAAGARYAGTNPICLAYTTPLLMEFCLGLLIGHVVLKEARHPDGAPGPVLGGTALLLAGCATASLALAPPAGGYAQDVGRFLKAGLPSAGLLYLLVRIETAGRLPRWRWLNTVGDASYSLYLSHTFVLALARRLWQRRFDIHSLNSHRAFILAATLLSVGVAVGIWRFVERPMTELLTRAWQRSFVRPGARAALPPS